MSRIFLSHSSANNAEAIAVRDWMAKQGWEDVFLDLDPERGLKAGQRWQDALKQAAARCEMVIFLISPAWVASKWCQAEFLLAKSLNKRIFAAIVQPTPFDDLPVEMTAEWQVVDLTAGARDYKATVTVPPGNVTVPIEFGSDGLRRLRVGLREAGLDPSYFAWPPEGDADRSPYPGLRALEAEDAGIFFGREAPTILALDRLRGMREAAPPRLLVIQGASGAGKSSFLRAGLIPRLKREPRLSHRRSTTPFVFRFDRFRSDTPDSNSLISSSAQTHLYPTRLDDLIALACTTAGSRPLAKDDDKSLYDKHCTNGRGP